MTDDTTRKLDDIVKSTKSRKDMGVSYMKSWELAREYIEEGREEERANTEAERKRAEAAENRVRELEAQLAALSG